MLSRDFGASRVKNNIKLQQKLHTDLVHGL